VWFVSAASAVPYTPVIEELTSTPPNVLIILADDLGVDNVAVYGEDPQPPKTPNLDALAGQGVRFTNAYGYPICSPTRAALLTGRMARRTGMGAIVEWNDTYELPLDEVLIPEMLELGGWDYSTTAVGKWHLSAPQTPNAFAHPNLQGFDTYKGVIHNLYFEADDGEEHGKEGGEGGKGGKAGHGDGGHDGDGKNDYYHYDYVVNGELGRGEVYATPAADGRRDRGDPRDGGAVVPVPRVQRRAFAVPAAAPLQPPAQRAAAPALRRHGRVHGRRDRPVAGGDRGPAVAHHRGVPGRQRHARRGPSRRRSTSGTARPRSSRVAPTCRSSSPARA
jgi:hypothetical protein